MHEYKYLPGSYKTFFIEVFSAALTTFSGLPQTSSVIGFTRQLTNCTQLLICRITATVMVNTTYTCLNMVTACDDITN